MKNQKFSAPTGAPHHVVDLVNQLNRVVPQLQQAIEENQKFIGNQTAQIATINKTLAGLTPEALQALILSLVGG